MTTPITTQTDFYRDIKALLHSARNKVYQTINQTMTQTYWEIGRRIVEQEQQGHARAQYGAMLIKTLSQELSQEFGKGFSVDNLKNMRRFYQCFPKSETASHQFTLSWSHYIFLTRINNDSERRFYEIEATNNHWSLKELKHQDLGQLMMYVNYYDRTEKQHDENPTIGIVLCKDKSNALVEITLPDNNNQLFASQYQTLLPNKDEFKALLKEAMDE